MSLFNIQDLNILADKRLSPIDKIVYFALVSFMNKDTGKCYPRFSKIRERCGVSRSAIQRSIKYLAKLQLISKKRLSSTNLYLLTRQLLLEETVKKRRKSLYETSEVSRKRLLLKPKLYNQYSYKRNVNSFVYRTSYSGGSDNPSIEYKGKQYKPIGSIDHWYEYENKEGMRIRKHKFKNTIEEDKPRESLRSKKKFEAAAKAVFCG